MIKLSGKVCDVAAPGGSACKEIEIEISNENYALFNSYSTDLLSQTWAIAFGSVLFFYFVSLAVGRILGFIRSESNRI